jgi:O-antigen/teichoic acid export membrane protein
MAAQPDDGTPPLPSELLAPPSRPTPSSRAHEFATVGRNALKLALSLTVTWTVAFFVRFPIPRILGPARFGLLNFGDNFATTFFSLMDLGVSTYIYREIPTKPKHASDMWGGVTLVRSLASVLLFLAMAGTLAAKHQTREVQETVFVFGLAQFVMVFNGSLSAFLHATSKVNRIAVANVVSKLMWGLGLGAALFFSRALPLLAAPMLASELLRFVILYPAAKRAVDLKHRIDWKATKAVLLWSLPVFISNGAINLGGGLNVAVLEFVTPDQREVGWFGASQNLASLTMLLSPLLSWVLLPLLARAKERSEEEVFAILRRTVEGLLVVVTPLTLVVSLGADLWIRLAFRAPYAPAAMSLRILALGFLLIYLAMTLSTLLILLGHRWSVSMISLAAVPGRPLLVWLLAAPCSRHFGLGGAAVGAALAEVITSVGIVAAHFIPIGGRALDRRLLMAGGKSLLVAGVVMAIDRTVLQNVGYARLLIDTLAYVGLALAIGVEKVSEITKVVRLVARSRKGSQASAGAAAS